MKKQDLKISLSSLLVILTTIFPEDSVEIENDKGFLYIYKDNSTSGDNGSCWYDPKNQLAAAITKLWYKNIINFLEVRKQFQQFDDKQNSDFDFMDEEEWKKHVEQAENLFSEEEYQKEKKSIC